MNPPGAGEVKQPDLDSEVRLALGVIDALASAIGPRPPGSPEEALAAEVIAAELRLRGLDPSTEEFSTARSFGPSYLVVFGLAIAAGFIEKRSRWLGAMAGGSAAALGLAESRFSQRGPTGVLRRRRSQNVRATLQPSGEVDRTVCLVSHMDSSRSGLMFHPRITPHLGKAVAVVGVATAVQALAPLLNEWRIGRLVLGLARKLVLTGAALILERELHGQDVAGANDNASGVGACVALAGHFASKPLERTRLVVLITGSEESGVFGMRNFLNAHDTSGWLFVNFDGVGADAPLRVLSKEGGPLSNLQADPELLELAAAIGRERPDLRAEPLPDGSGLPYDATPVLQGRGRAISIVNQEGAIPNYHWPTDTADRISPPALKKAIEFGAALVRRLDHG